MDDFREYPRSHHRPRDFRACTENPKQGQTIPRRMGRSCSPHRLALLCRLRRQDVCPPHQQRQAYLSVHLLTVHKSPMWDALQTQHRINESAYCPLSPICSEPSPSIRRMTGPSLSDWSRKHRPAQQTSEVQEATHKAGYGKTACCGTGSFAL